MTPEERDAIQLSAIRMASCFARIVADSGAHEELRLLAEALYDGLNELLRREPVDYEVLHCVGLVLVSTYSEKGSHETAITTGGDTYAIERYTSEENAKSGHERILRRVAEKGVDFYALDQDVFVRVAAGGEKVGIFEMGKEKK